MRRKLTMSTRIYLSNMFLILVAVLLTGILCLRVTLSNKQRDLDAIITDAASLIAQSDMTRQALEDGVVLPVLRQQLDLMLQNMEYVDILVVCDTNSTRLYHNNEERVGEAFVGGDENAILQGAEPYISEAEGTLGLQRRAFHAVTDKNGQIVGFVMASMLSDHLTDIRNQILLVFLGIAVLLLLLGLLFSAAAEYALRKNLLGYEPEQLIDLYVERGEVLDALEEGLFAINSKGNVIIMNQSAKRMLGLPPETRTDGEPLTKLFPETRLPDVMRTGVAEHNINYVIKNRNIISSRIPVRTDGEIIGAVSIFRDKTEVTKMAEQLTGANTMVDTLRAFNHEFMNKLHIILGLLETGDVAQAKTYIMGTSLVSGEAVSDITHRVPISKLAAMLIGKMLRANELGIQFSLKVDSYFYPKQDNLPDDCYITLVGNLLENALYELNSPRSSQTNQIKEIKLGIYSEQGHTLITCDDTGGGIPPEVLANIYDRHVTTKGEGHGTGFALIKEIVDRYQGDIHIETELGYGTSVEITLPV